MSSVTKRVIVGVVIVILAVALAIVAIRTLKPVVYSRNINHAEEMMKQGEYDNAEASYNSALKIDKNRTEAREGLAYVYYLQERYADSEKEYKRLYKNTGEEKYKKAADSVGLGMMVADPDLAVETNWHTVNDGDVPYFDMLMSFMNASAWPADREYGYDSSELCPVEDLYYMMQDICFRDWSVDQYSSCEEGPNENIEYIGGVVDDSDADPRGWFRDTQYTRFEKDFLQTQLRNVLNFSDDQMDALIEYGNKNHCFYEEDGYYYWDLWPSDRIIYGVRLVKVMTNGIRYCFVYDTGQMAEYEESINAIDYNLDYYTYYEMLEFKKINGTTYLTLRSNSPERPKEIDTYPENKEGINAAYTDILLNNERSIKAYIWPVDENYKAINQFDEFEDIPYLEHPDNKSVIIRDLNGDTVPELMFMSSNQLDMAQLHIYTFSDGRAQECKYKVNYNDEIENDYFEDFRVGGESYCAIYTGVKDGVFYTINSRMNNDGELICNQLKMDKDGKIVQTDYIYERFNEWDELYKCDEFTIDGKKVDVSTGKKALKKVGADLAKPLLMDGPIKEIDEAADTTIADSLGMTFDEALVYLAEKE